jgi:CBS domain-containing protein
MRADQIMTTPVVTVRDNAPAREAIALMAQHRVTSLPVLDEGGGIVGMVSEVDLLRHRIAHDPRTHLRATPADSAAPGGVVSDVMTDVVICLSRNADTAEVAEALVDNRIRAVPILEGADLVGIVSRRDLLKTLLRDDTGIAADVQERLDSFAGVPGRWRADVAEGCVTIDGPIDADNAERTRHVLDSLARTVPGVVRVTVIARSLR